MRKTDVGLGRCVDYSQLTTKVQRTYASGDGYAPDGRLQPAPLAGRRGPFPGRTPFSRIPVSCAREETPESRGMPCLFLNTERGFGGKPPQKSGFRRHLAGSKMPKEGSKMPKETFFHGDLPLEVVSRRALDASGF